MKSKINYTRQEDNPWDVLWMTVTKNNQEIYCLFNMSIIIKVVYTKDRSQLGYH